MHHPNFERDIHYPLEQGMEVSGSRWKGGIIYTLYRQGSMLLLPVCFVFTIAVTTSQYQCNYIILSNCCQYNFLAFRLN